MRTPLPRVTRRVRLVVTIVVAIVLFFTLLGWIVGTWTDWLWFSEAGYTQVFRTVLGTKITMFLVVGLGMALVLAGNLVLAYRLRPMLRTHSLEQQALDRYRAVLGPHMPWVIGAFAGLIGFFGGLAAQGHWSTWLLYSHAQSFGIRDPQFHVDIGWYVFKYPFYRYLLGVGFATIVFAIIGSLAVHYLFGGVRLQGAGERMTTAARAHLTALVAAFVLLKAIAYVLDRRGLALSHNGAIDLYGAGYTAVNALLPAKEILGWIALIVAVAILVFSNAFLRNLFWPGMALGLLAISAIAVGVIYPAAVQTFTVKPNIRDKEAVYIQRSIDATRAAFGLSTVNIQSYSADNSTPQATLASDTDTVGNARLLDPSVLSNTYTQLQQSRGFYDFTQKLDIDRYTIGGKLQDYVVGIREMDYSQLSGQQGNWQNRHTVYTHGYGFVAAPANETMCGGQPYFVSGFLGDQSAQQGCQSPGDQIPVNQPRIYFGENMSSYALVGKAPGGNDAEYDRPTGGNNDQYVTYDGSGGVSVGSYWRRLLYGYKYKEFNFLISSVFNQNTKILYVRDPRERVQKIAPFLTLDGDPYPAVVDGRITWIVDGYTTASTYPYSSQVDLHQATSDTLTGAGSVAQAAQNVNYLRNSVKATVDAYTGKVTLYAFGAPDPVLMAWNSAFGGKLIKPASDIPPDLAVHFRYPEDQFKVQRQLLTRFHVTEPNQFYSQQNVWAVPDDPTGETSANQAPYYLLARFPGQDATTFQLTAAMTFRGRQNLAALVTGSYVDGQPTLTVLQLPDDTTVFGPVQAHQKMTNDPGVRNQITLFSSARTIYGNLLSLPVGGGMLYVEPLYIQSNQANAYPQLKFVLLNFGQYVAFADNVQAGLSSLILQAAKGPPGNGTQQPPGNTTSPPPTVSPPTVTNPAVSAAVQQINKALSDLEAAQKSGDFAAYGNALNELKAAIAAYQKAVAASGATPAPSGGPTATPAPSR